MKSKPNHFLGALVCAAAALEDSALFCASVGMPATATGEFMFMPGGMQSITPFGGGIGQPIQVLVDSQAAVQLEKQRAALEAKGAKPYFDFEHEDQGASFWPTLFFWKDGESPGIYCRGEWTADGKAGVDGKRWRGFSPVFHVDSKRARPAQIICNAEAVPNMGGLVNNPAFKKISPLWAKNAGGAQSATTNKTDDMTPEELAALQAKNTELTTEIARLKSEQTAIKAKNENDELVSARIEAKEAQLKAAQAELESAALKTKNDEQAGEIRKQRAATAKEIVGAAVCRGAIAAKDTDTIAAWEKDITENPERGALLAKMGGNPAIGGQRLTTPANSRLEVTGISANEAIRSYGAVVAKNAAIPLSHATAAQKGELAREAAAIFAADISKNPVILDMSMDQAIKAADYSDAVGSVGLLSGSLVLQRALPLMLTNNPMIGAVSTDFSDEPGLLNQTQNTRILLKPAVQTYDATLDTGGRPKGWVTASPAQSVDVPVTLSDYVGIPLVFGISTLASTTRRLFDESAPLAVAALGDYCTSKLSALMTAANFVAYKGTSIGSGATTSGSKSITFASTTIVFPGQAISGTGIPSGTYIASVESATAATLTQKATATGSALTFTLNNSKVPTTYTTFVKALASWTVAELDNLAAAFDANDVPMTDRFAALSPAYYRKLGGDSNVLALMQGTGDSSYLTDRRLPKMSNFELMNSPWMPSASNQTGFAGHKAALVLKTRLPQDLTGSLPGVSAPGSVTTITDPSTGLTMSLVQYFNLQGNYAEWRPEIMLGAAVGDRRAGLVITSA
jgi:hypothetical protein